MFIIQDLSLGLVDNCIVRGNHVVHERKLFHYKIVIDSVTM